MSEYYEFRAVDSPLTQTEMRELRALSTRATITPTSFSNTYDWGNFKGNPDRLVEKYFDAFVYTANGCTRELIIRLPLQALGYKMASTYRGKERMRVRKTSEFVMLDFLIEVEDAEWEDDEGWMDSLIPLRAELMRGDLRCLYLAWLLCAQNGEFHKNDVEPPVPPGLRKLTAPLESFASFTGLDADLIQAAAEASSDSPACGPSRSELAAWIADMPESDKNALLLEMVERGSSPLQTEFLRRFAERSSLAKQRSEAQSPEHRTVGQLLAAAQSRTAERQRCEAERRAAEQARREKEEAAARVKYLNKLAGREAQIWERIDALAQTKQPNNYARAVNHLVDLRDLAARRGQEPEFDSALERLRRSHQMKPSFLRRLAAAGL